MDEDKKKKRNKKKRNKQNKTQESLVVCDGETASSVNQSGMSNGQDHNGQVTEKTNVENNDSEQNVDLGLGTHLPNGTEGSVIVEAEKQQWLQRVATLEEGIKQLQNENYSHIQKEAILEEAAKQLRNELYSHTQKEAGLQMKLVELQSEKDSWIEKEAGLKERINQLLDGKASLGLKVTRLEEKIKDLEREKESWMLKENSTKETIASLNGDITRLQAQVMELEESRKNLSQENQRLVEDISGTQSQILNLERSIASAHSSNETSEHEDLNSQMEGARALVAKLISENAELAEKVNELYVELDQRNASSVRSSVIESDLKVETAEIVAVGDPNFGSNENMPVSGEKLESLEVVPIKVERIGNGNVDGQHVAAVPNSSEADGSGEIEQIPLDDNEIVELELQEAAKTSEKGDVPLSDDPLPLSDAPLIGAPFRFISFVAKYVSGGDLVNKN